ncbi:hypothetical protein CAPTEDRAFT_205318 [Capitella teleta]|uniref:G-protein coupled receptors family 1 profile domain-containing protein n=1 Tax=Capitella teleta TaxID=283909 RepID=R7TJN9_CAPTE|nr:hypothetical protein CAPTEDRAFT_205318 [Capitella teleta]|eukprot:ELT93919.1 hypothetical protein CAPTEDRAFT_205318 [Capitella teleta]
MTYNTTYPSGEVSPSDFDIDNTTTSISVIDAQPTKDITIWYPWALAAAYVILLIGLCLNMITAIAYMKSSLLSGGKPVHLLIFNMTISDLASCLLGQMFIVFQYTDAGSRYVMTRQMVCITNLVGLVISYDSTVTALLLITCERLVAIISPFEHMHRVTRKTARVAIVINWVLLAIKNNVLFVWNRWKPYVPCIGLYVMPDVYVLYVYNTTLYGCMGLIFLLNVILGIAVIVAKTKTRNMNVSHMKSSRSELKIVKMIFLVVGVLFVTWMPNNTFGNIIITAITQKTALPYDILIAHHMTRGVTVMGAVANPLIYFLKNEQCRAAVLKLFGHTEASWSRRHKRQDQSVYSLNSVQTATTQVTGKVDE